MNWQNNITLDHIRHDAALVKLMDIMNRNNKTSSDIAKLEIVADAGYVHYTVMFRDGSVTPHIFDDGSTV